MERTEPSKKNLPSSIEKKEKGRLAKIVRRKRP